jgi:hypothetical protein
MLNVTLQTLYHQIILSSEISMTLERGFSAEYEE